MKEKFYLVIDLQKEYLEDATDLDSAIAMAEEIIRAGAWGRDGMGGMHIDYSIATILEDGTNDVIHEGRCWVPRSR